MRLLTACLAAIVLQSGHAEEWAKWAQCNSKDSTGKRLLLPLPELQTVAKKDGAYVKLCTTAEDSVMPTDCATSKVNGFVINNLREGFLQVRRV